MLHKVHTTLYAAPSPRTHPQPIYMAVVCVYILKTTMFNGPRKQEPLHTAFMSLLREALHNRPGVQGFLDSPL